MIAVEKKHKFFLTPLLNAAVEGANFGILQLDSKTRTMAVADGEIKTLRYLQLFRHSTPQTERGTHR